MADANRRIEELRRELSGNPASRQFYQLGELLRRDGRGAEAAEVLRAGLAHHPRYVAAWVALGRASLDLGNADEAVTSLREGLVLDSQNPVAWRLLGEAHMALGDRLSALDAMQRCLELVPGDEVLTSAVEALSQETLPPAPRPEAAPSLPETAAPAAEPPAPPAAAESVAQAPAFAPAPEVQAPPADAAPFASAALGETAGDVFGQAPPPASPADAFPSIAGDVFALELAPLPPAATEGLVFDVPELAPAVIAMPAAADATPQALAVPTEPFFAEEATPGEGAVTTLAVEPSPEVEEVAAPQPLGEEMVAPRPFAEAMAPAVEAPAAIEAPSPAAAPEEVPVAEAAPPRVPPVPPPPAAPLQPRATVSLARLYVQQQDLPQAAQVLERVLDRDGSNTEARELLALVHDMMEPMPAALPPLAPRERKIAALQRWLASLTLGQERAAS